MRPVLIPHKLKPLFHNKKSCIDARDGQVHAIKANTNNRTWHNKVKLQTALISINPRTRCENEMVYKSKTPFHVLSFGCGADTYYWGRYLCIGGRNVGKFELKFIDDGSLEACLQENDVNYRSKLETNWSNAFKEHNIDAIFEPATMKLGDGTEYTPDFWLPATSTFIEIKGPPPSEREFLKCSQTSQLGFNIKMFRGGPKGFEVYNWSKKGVMTSSACESFYRYLHPVNTRKRRKVHNVS